MCDYHIFFAVFRTGGIFSDTSADILWLRRKKTERSKDERRIVMCTLIYSAKSHRKIAHFPHCKILKRIPKESRRTFDSLEDAREHGYRICQCCPPAAQKYRKERKRVREFCKAHGLAVEILNGVVNVYSRHDVWKIVAKINDSRSIIRT